MIKNKISDYKLKKQLKQYSPKKIIYKHITNEITLTAKQINMLLRLGDNR